MESYAVHLKNIKKRKKFLMQKRRPFGCPQCDYRASYSRVLSSHILSVHSDVRPFACTECDYKARRKDTLENHIMTHTNEKPYECPHCNYRARQEFVLGQHILLHTGEKPYPCPHCSYKSRQSGHLRRHLRLKHNRDQKQDMTHSIFSAALSSGDSDQDDDALDTKEDDVFDIKQEELMFKEADYLYTSSVESPHIENNAKKKTKNKSENAAFYPILTPKTASKQKKIKPKKIGKKVKPLKRAKKDVPIVTEPIVMSPELCKRCLEGFADYVSLMEHKKTHLLFM